jgi:hypothetical protein
MRVKENGNTLVPVIIALSISAIATIAFLKQGGDLQQKNKRLMAQNELASELKNWNVLKRAKGLKNVVQVDLPVVRNNNAFGKYVSYQRKNPIFMRPILVYGTDSDEACEFLKSVFTSRLEGVSSNLFNGADNPNCATTDLIIILD